MVDRSLQSLVIDCCKDEGKIEDEAIVAILEKLYSRIKTFAFSVATDSMNVCRISNSDWHRIRAGWKAISTV